MSNSEVGKIMKERFPDEKEFSEESEKKTSTPSFDFVFGGYKQLKSNRTKQKQVGKLCKKVFPDEE